MYKIQSMSEVNDIEKQYKVVSLFSGCGGSSLGYKMAGLNVLLANEFIPKAIENYKLNHKNTIVLEDDVRKITGEQILNAIGLKRYELDILDGSPPCSSFSTVGAKERNWGKVIKYSDTKQRTDDLFFEYIRLVNDIMPKIFVAENVKGLTQSKAKDVLTDILEQLSVNYNVEYKVLTAKDYGVPQNRQRTIIIGIRKDLNMNPSFPERNIIDDVTVRDAFENVKQNNEQIQMLYDAMNKYTKIKNVVEKIPRDPLKPTDGTVAFNGERKFFSLIRVSNYKPANTIVDKGGDLSLGCGLVHPTEDRKLTIPELKRLQSFPDDFILTGTYRQQYERIARSVPPLMMKAIANHLKINFLDKIKNT